MADLQVTGIRKSDPNGGHAHITHVGGAGWVKERQTAVSEIGSGANSFYVVSPTGKRADVRIYEKIYLRTVADGVWTDNLLSLPKC